MTLPLKFSRLQGPRITDYHVACGALTEYTKLMAEAREQALDRMLEEAERLGADAVLEVRFTTSVIMGGAAVLLAYGTAVQVAQEE